MERIYHTWDKWECFPAGFYNPKPPAKEQTIEECRDAYATFLRDTPRFEAALNRVLSEWPHSCEHYLTNERMNRIAWLGQAAMCIETGVSKFFCGGYFKLTNAEQVEADKTALKALNKWMTDHGEDPLTLDSAACKTQTELY